MGNTCCKESKVDAVESVKVQSYKPIEGKVDIVSILTISLKLPRNRPVDKNNLFVRWISKPVCKSLPAVKPVDHY